MSDSYDAFISYHSSDLHFAERLFDLLRTEGFEVWFDKARLLPGYDWHREIEHGADVSRVILAVVTPAWMESAWCRFETYGAEHIIPLLHSGDWSEVAPPPLKSYQFLDYRTHSKATFEQLCALIRQYVSRSAPQKVARMVALPYAHNPYFVGRENLFLDVHERLHAPPSPRLSGGTTLALVGAGGVGKTSLAREYAEKFWRLYQDILWVRGHPQTFTTELARLALILKLAKEPSSDVAVDARRAIAALNERTPRLLIIDNALDESSIQQWVPTTGLCRTIITSRFAGWSAAVPSVSVDVLVRESSQEFLLNRCGSERNSDSIRSAGLLAEQLGDLPLALEQAGAFMRKAKIDFKEYHRLFEESRRDLLSTHTLGGTQYPESVTTTWFTTVRQLGPEARAVLRLISFLAPDEIPIWLFESGAVMPAPLSERLLDSVRRAVRPLLRPGAPSQSRKISGPLSAAAIRITLAELADYSIIKLAAKSFSIHRLTQAAQTDGLRNRERRFWIRQAVLLVQRNFPAVVAFSHLATCELLFPHAKAVAGHAKQIRLNFIQLVELLVSTATYLQLRGEYPQAAALVNDVLQLCRDSPLGKKHPYYGTALNNLGHILFIQGRYPEAEQLFNQAIAQGDSTFSARLGLALVYSDTGRYQEAEYLNREVLESRAAAFGTDHPRYADGLNNLAVMYMEQRRYPEAEKLLGQAVEILRARLGEEDPSFAQAINNLAAVCYREGKYAEAEPLYLQALRIRESTLGDKHVELGFILTNLGTLYRGMGRYDDAVRYYDRALAIRRATVGEGHPSFAETLTRVAMLHDKRGDHEGADKLHHRALEIARATLDDDNPLVAEIIENYAASLTAANKPLEARRMEKEVERIRARHTRSPSHAAPL